MKRVKINFRLTVALIGLMTCNLGQAQTMPPKKVPYYININHTSQGTVHEILDQQLFLEYDDVYGTAKEITMNIYDWKRSIVASITMDKSLGTNNYTLDLNTLFGGWELNKVYTGELKNEAGTLYKLPIRLIERPKTNGPDISILVNPLQVGCGDLSQSVVEFYGNIAGGKAPYSVNWYVLDKAKTDFLYQPKEEIIALAGKTSQVTVDRNPEYNVVLYVKDACGNEQKKIVNLTCSKKRKKINTVFVEELHGIPSKTQKIR